MGILQTDFEFFMQQELWFLSLILRARQPVQCGAVLMPKLARVLCIS